MIANEIQPISTESTQLDQMDTYSLLGIFDNLNFEELLYTADISARIRDIIETHYMVPKYQIHEKPTFISLYDKSDESSAYLVIQKTLNILKFLRNFGHNIEKIKFDAYGYGDDDTIISEYIAKYCSNSLNEINLYDGGYYLLNAANETFNQIRSLHFAVSEKKLNNLEIHRIYPRLERLKIYARRPIASQYLAYEFPYLIDLDYSDGESSVDYSTLQRLLEANAQLRSLSINMLTTFEALQMIHDNSPALETLSFVRREGDFFDANRTIHFESVRNFAVHKIVTDFDGRDDFPITFEHLNSLEIAAILNEAMFDLIQRNQKIEMLSISYRVAERSMKRLLNILNDFSTLKTITLLWPIHMDSDEFWTSLNGLKSLTTIKFMSWTRHLDGLSEEMPTNWKHVGSSKFNDMNCWTLLRESE